MQNISPYQIIKASGEEENYSEEKLVGSLARTGMSVNVANQTVDYLKKHLKTGLTTTDIYGHVSQYLKENAPIQDYYNYSLKRAIMQLGPSGHPFEILVGDLLESQGFETQVGVTLGGECVTHEIDVIAVKGNDTYFIECKYHNQPGTKSDVQVALYTYARFLDIQAAMKKLFGPEKSYHPWLVVNTKLTYDALDYSKCVGIKPTTWSLPHGENLQKMIIDSGLHPITIIDSIPVDKIQALLARDIVTCQRLNRAIINNSVNEILNAGEIEHAKEDIKIICEHYGKHSS